MIDFLSSEKAGVGGSTPSLATIFSITCGYSINLHINVLAGFLWACGVCVGDYNHDGFEDLFVARRGIPGACPPMSSGNSTKAYLAFEFGAESGRAVLGHLHSGLVTIQEVHRFPNEPVTYGGSLHWDTPRLWLEVRKALSRLEVTELHGIGVNAWGVDYALLGERGELLQNPYHYRDARTVGVMDDVFRLVRKEDIYRTTGIQFMQINTLYQLFAAQRDTPLLLQVAKTLVTIPDLFDYWLTGNAGCEFTNATSTQLVNASTRAWATDLMDQLGLPSRLPAPIIEPASTVGTLLPGICHHSSIAGAPVIAPASHDTSSAVAAVRAREGTVF